MFHCTNTAQNSVEPWLPQFCHSTGSPVFKQSFSKHIFSYLCSLVVPTWECSNYLNVRGMFEGIWGYTSVHLAIRLKMYSNIGLCNSKEERWMDNMDVQFLEIAPFEPVCGRALRAVQLLWWGEAPTDRQLAGAVGIPAPANRLGSYCQLWCLLLLSSHVQPLSCS